MTGMKDPVLNDKVLDLWAKGMSANEVARIMKQNGYPDITRNVIAGIAKRARQRNDARGFREEPHNRQVKAPKPRRLPKSSEAFVGVTRRAANLPEPKPLVVVENPDDYPKVTLMDLQPHHCRWPLATERGGIYCGAPKSGRAYCSFHHNIAYTRVEK